MKTALALALLWLAMPAAQAQVPLPPFESLVTDLTGTLTAEQQANLDEKLTAFQKRKGSQVALLILPTTQPEDIAQFGVRLAEAWRIGREGIDDGAILIVAKDDRAMRIEVQYGLEGALTDITSSRILNEIVAPLFRQGDFFGGVNAGLDQILKVIDGEPLPPPDPSWSRERSGGLPWPVLIFGGLMLVSMLRPVIGRAPAAAAVGLGGGALSFWVGAALLEAIGAGIVLFILGLMFGFGGLGAGSGRVFRDWGGGRRGGFGGGGFGGGLGGRGGGGGASARW